MIDKKEVAEKELFDKINSLFVYRKLPYLIEKAGASNEEQKELISKLIHLQVAIYKLDHYLETHWLIDKAELETWWAPIYTSLLACGIPEHKHQNYLSQIRKYQKHELQLREGKYPSRLGMEYFYFYKSCDVKLLRRIIYTHYPNLKSFYSLANWRAFDLTTEIDDDIEDVFEDQSSINANRYLIDCVKHGVVYTSNYYKAFLNKIEENYFSRFDTLNPKQQELKKWSLEENSRTKLRLEEVSNKIMQGYTLKLAFELL